MAAWKLAPALACGNDGDPQAGRDDAADRAAAGRDLPGGRASAGRRARSCPATARPARRSCARPDIDKIAFTGSTAVGRDIQAALAGTSAPADARARRQVGEHRVRGRRARPGGRGDRQRHLLQPGPRVLRGLAAAHPGERARRGDRQAVAADAPAAGRRPARQEHRRRRDQLGRAARADRGAGRGREAGGRDAAHDRVRAARARLLVRADAVHRRLARPPDRGRGDLRAGGVGAHLPHPGRGDREGQQLALRAGGRDLDRQGRQGVRGGRARSRPASCGRTPTTTSTRPPRSAATRSRASGARAARPGCGRTSRSCR